MDLTGCHCLFCLWALGIEHIPLKERRQTFLEIGKKLPFTCTEVGRSAPQCTPHKDLTSYSTHLYLHKLAVTQYIFVGHCVLKELKFSLSTTV